MSPPDDPVTGMYWTELRIFVEVANARSFNRAAQRLGVSHATIGRAVRRLEEELGIPLITEAFARGVKLTPSGARLARELAQFDQRLSAMLRRVCRSYAKAAEMPCKGGAGPD
jgi:DNA-binding transcriptional LysR family regulator